MDILKINDIEYNMSSPLDNEYIKQNILSFGDDINNLKPIVNVQISHIDGLRLDLYSNTDDNFYVTILDKNENVIYDTFLSNNMFCQLYPKYIIGTKYKIYHNSTLIKEETINFKGKKIYISFESSSVGDTIAWIPYCEQFKKEHQCEVIVSTFKNYMFEKTYPNLTFVEPGSIVNNIHGIFRIGWFYDNTLEPENPETIPLQKAATNILNLDFQELQTKIYFEPKERPYTEKYICIAPMSTAGCKLWNHPTGWSDLAKFLNNNGYKVINISKDGDEIDGVINIEDDSMENTMNIIHHSEFVIGLSSGLSWVSWGLGKHVVMISNFSEKDHEFTTNCTRIINEDVCHGCWNNPEHKFDKGDWYWCPLHKGTDRQFECHKSITPEMVINNIKYLL